MRKKILALMLTVMIGSAQVMTVSAAKTTDELEQQKAQTTAQLSETHPKSPQKLCNLRLHGL